MSSPRASASRVAGNSTDTVLRIILIVMAAALLLLIGLFGYSGWQSQRSEANSTPAQRALNELEKFVKADPGSAAGRVRYGEALASAGLVREAAEQLKAAVKIDKKHTGAWLDLGLISLQEKQTKQARKYFIKVVELTEGNQYQDLNQRREQALFHLGEIALDANEHEDAVGYFKEALRIRRDASDTYYLLAQALHGLGKDDAALDQLDAALAFDPRYAEANYLYGEILMSMGRDGDAAPFFRTAADAAPDSDRPQEALAAYGDPDVALTKAEKALASGDLVEAVSQGRIAFAVDPQSLDSAVVLAQALNASRKTSEALAVAQAAQKLKADDPRVISLLKSLKD